MKEIFISEKMDFRKPVIGKVSITSPMLSVREMMI
jgi:hypothetical protein